MGKNTQIIIRALFNNIVWLDEFIVDDDFNKNEEANI